MRGKITRTRFGREPAMGVHGAVRRQTRDERLYRVKENRASKEADIGARLGAHRLRQLQES